MPEKVNVRGVSFDNVTLDEAVEILIKNNKNNIQTAMFTPNSEIVQMCIDNNELYEIIGAADLTLPDGIGVVKASKILKNPLRCRVPGYDTGEKLISLASKENLKIFFLGGKPGIAETAAAKMSEKYPGTAFVGCHDGYFNKTGPENDLVIDEIIKSGANVLFVCLGAPAQEKWIVENRSKLKNVNLLLALGGSLDGYSGNVKRAPAFFIRLNLEWFYRLLCQPSRIIRMMKLPQFYFGTWLYRLKSKSNE